jgi:hypothetical protein
MSDSVDTINAQADTETASAHNERTASHLIGTPLLGDEFEESFSMLGYSCDDDKLNRP